MADLNVNFQHPTDQRVITVTVDDSMTAQEAISELLANNFVLPGEYQLVYDNNGLGLDQTFADAGVRNGAKIRVNTNAMAGARTRNSR